MNLRVPLMALAVSFSLAACSGSGPSEAPWPPEADGAQSAVTGFDPSSTPVLQSDSGMAEGVLGIYFLTIDPADPLHPVLTPPRSGGAQGDVTYLSARPFLTPTSLTVASSVAGPAGSTDYTMRFVHPFALPPDLNQPSTAAKRIDLHVFDLMMVVARTGSDTFFSGTARTNLNFCGNPDGFRQIGPLLDLASLGVGTTNVFPYRSFTRNDPAFPAGNFDAALGWSGVELLSPRGYDVIPQGSTTDAVLRLQTSQITTVPIIMMGKYLEPKFGSTRTERHQFRLPNPVNPNGLKYFLPEAAGDLASTAVTVNGAASDVLPTSAAVVTATVLDWDNAATIAATWPDYTNLMKIRKNSAPYDAAISVPLLNASSLYTPVTTSAPYGPIQQWVDFTFDVTNVDLTYVAPPGGGDLPGLIRIRDRQAIGSPAYALINESLLPVTAPAGFEPYTRYQRVVVHVTPDSTAPDITGVDPESGVSGQLVDFSVINMGGTGVTWDWNFGAGTSPGTSTLPEPSLLLGAPGTYPSSVQVTNAFGSDTYNFDLVVHPTAPVITGVSPPNAFALRQGTFSATYTGLPATAYSWNFGTAGLPATSTAPAPTITLTAPGTYNCSVMVTNAVGNDTYNFQITAETKKIGLAITVIKFNATTWPTLWHGLAAWDQTSMRNWVNAELNPVFRNAGIEFDLAQVTMNSVVDAPLFVIDTSTEYNNLWNNYIFNASPTRLRLVAISAMNLYPGVGGAMGDGLCGYDNNNRGCWVISTGTTNLLRKFAAHEIGHILSLPHIRTSVTPINTQNMNLMSYGPNDVSLSSWITSEDPNPSCRTWQDNPMNQYGVANNWSWSYLP